MQLRLSQMVEAARHDATVGAIICEKVDRLCRLTIDPTRDYQPLNGRWPVHNVLRQASSMS